MDVVIVRHGEAKEAEGGRDCDRALTARGWRQAEALGAWLRPAGQAPVVASGYRRTRETAGCIAEAIGVEVSLEPRLELGTGSQALEVLEAWRETGTSRVVLVGHQPQMCDLIAALLIGPGGGGGSVGLRTGEAYHLWAPEAGELVGRCRLLERVRPGDG